MQPLEPIVGRHVAFRVDAFGIDDAQPEFARLVALRHTGEAGDGEDDAAAAFTTEVVDDLARSSSDDSGPVPREPIESELEIDASIRELRLTRLHKVFWKDDNITKGDLIEY